MSRTRIEELWNRFLDGASLDAAEERELLDALDADPELRADFLEDQRIDGALAGIGHAEPDSEPFIRSISDRIRAERDGAQFVENFRRGIHEAKSAPASRRPARRLRRTGGDGSARWIGLAVAGVIAAAILIVALIPRGTPASPKPPAPRPSTAEVPPAVAPEIPPTPPPASVPGREVPPGRPKPTPQPEGRPKPATIPRSTPDAPEPRTAPPKTTPPPPKTITRIPAVATVVEFQGDVHRLNSVGAPLLTAGQTLRSGEGLLTHGNDARVVLDLADKSRLTVGADTQVSEILATPEGIRIVLKTGIAKARVTRQPEGKQLVFTTPHARATVLGTRLTLIVNDTSSRLEVREGRVRLKRLPGGPAVEVPAGHFAVAAATGPLRRRPLPIDEIVLRPRDAKSLGSVWSRVKDAEASTGEALEATRKSTWNSAGQFTSPGVTFAFHADADRDYALWLRGRCTAQQDRIRRDAVIVEIPNAQFTDQPGPRGKGLADRPTRGFYNGLSVRTGYWWIGGDADRGMDRLHLIVRFRRAGLQTLRLYAYETPVRIDALWLSTTRDSRPADDFPGPAPER